MRNEVKQLIEEGLRIKNAVATIGGSMRALADLRKQYLLWLDRIEKFLEKERPKLGGGAFFINDDVRATVGRGVGVDMSDPFAKSLLKDLKNGVGKKLEVLGGIRLRGFGKKINSIAFAEHDKGMVRYAVINDDYSAPLEIKVSKKYWGSLYEVADGKLLPAKDHKGFMDYFNSNDKNLIYTKTRCELTKILGIKDGWITKEIPMNIVSERAFRRRQNKGG